MTSPIISLERMDRIIGGLGLAGAAVAIVLGVIALAHSNALGVWSTPIVVFCALLFVASIVAILSGARHLAGQSVKPTGAEFVAMRRVEMRASPTKPVDPERVFLPDDVTPDFLIGLYKGQTTAQGRRRAELYVGKWKKLSGTLNDFETFNYSYSGARRCRADFQRVGGMEGLAHAHIMMSFKEKKWCDRLEVMNVGTLFTVVGQVSAITDSYVALDDCELVDA